MNPFDDESLIAIGVALKAISHDEQIVILDETYLVQEWCQVGAPMTIEQQIAYSTGTPDDSEHDVDNNCFQDDVIVRLMCIV